MSSGYSGRRFQCPFFKWDERKKVHCEGGVVALPVPELRRYMDRYCASLEDWEKCSFAGTLLEFYERDEENAVE